jgi:hypothetical protein
MQRKVRVALLDGYQGTIDGYYYRLREIQMLRLFRLF